MKLRALLLAGLVVTASASPLPARADAAVAADCYGELVASHPLVDRDGLGARTGIGQLRVDVYYSDAADGTTCVMTVGGNGTASSPIPMLAMIVTDDGLAALDTGDYRYHAAVTATGTAGRCVVVHGSTQLQPFASDGPSDLYLLPGDDRLHCND